MSRFVLEFTLRLTTAGLPPPSTAFLGKDGAGQQTMGELPEKPHWSCLQKKVAQLIGQIRKMRKVKLPQELSTHFSALKNGALPDSLQCVLLVPPLQR